MGIKAPLEKDVQKTCLAYLRALGAWAIRINSGAMKGSHKGKGWFMRFNDQPGCPDLLFCLNGRFGAWETKREGNEPTPLQMSALDAIRKAGGVAGWGTSVRDLEAMLERHGLVSRRVG